MRIADFFKISDVDVDASTLTNDATTYTDSFSLKQGNEILHYVNLHLIGASFGSSSLSIQPQQSDDGSDWVDVPDVSTISLDASTTSDSSQFVTAAPYIRLAITKTGTDALTLIAKALASKDVSIIAVSVALDSSEVTATVAELNVLADVTPGTSAASKAVVLDSNSKISALDITALKLNGNACDEAFLAGATTATTIAADVTATATTLTTAMALANALQAKVNDVIAKLKTSGIIASS